MHNRGKNKEDHLVGNRKRKKTDHCWKKAEGVINSRFSQVIGEVGIIHIVQTRNILGKKDKRI